MDGSISLLFYSFYLFSLNVIGKANSFSLFLWTFDALYITRFNYLQEIVNAVADDLKLVSIVLNAMPILQNCTIPRKYSILFILRGTGENLEIGNVVAPL